MCGRYTLTSNGRAVAAWFDLSETPVLSERYNIAPAQDVAIVRHGERGRECPFVSWGFGQRGARVVINARSETAATKPSFRDSLRSRRCLVPATGFIEWRHQGRARAAYHFRSRDSELLAMAGLWSLWPNGDGKAVESMVILTTSPNQLVADLHDRMPMILDRRDFDRWLEPQALDADELHRLAEPLAAERMERIPVSSRINSTRFDDPACLERVADEPVQQSLF